MITLLAERMVMTDFITFKIVVGMGVSVAERANRKSNGEENQISQLATRLCEFF